MSEKSSRQSLKPPLPMPSELMREWHPDLFSDSTTETTTPLAQGLLEYHLESLTSRKQEQLFEEFCRRIAEREICPNIRPQTGPTGGGDSKVDASSYPVAKDLADRLYWGTPARPSTESWGFAFSCKKRWKTKIETDAEKIAGTGRHYSKVYFITSQFVRDKDRDELEKKLTAKHGYDSHILDRQWIVKVVLEHGHSAIAIDALDMQISSRTETMLGPNDAENLQELKAVLERVREPGYYGGSDYVLATDYLRAARLARSVGKPRHEVEGLFQLARQLAGLTGDRGLQFRCGYHHAWTAFWWFDDAALFERILLDVAPLIEGTWDIDECESLLTLLFVYHGPHFTGESPNPGYLSKRERLQEGVKRELKRFAGMPSMPNASLQAQTMLLTLKIHENKDDLEAVACDLQELNRCLDECVSLGTYPALKFIKQLRVFGRLPIADLPEYETLLDKMQALTRERAGETEEGEFLYGRGLDCLEKEQFSKALVHLGKARRRLYKHETLHLAGKASLDCSATYSAMGLLWAANMEGLLAAQIATQKERGEFRFPVLAFWAYHNLAEVNLRLGRISVFLAWTRYAALALGVIRAHHLPLAPYETPMRRLDLCFASGLASMEMSELHRLHSLDAALDALELTFSRWVLLHRTGRHQLIDIEDVEFESGDGVLSVESHLGELADILRATAERLGVPERYWVGSERYRPMSTELMGVRYTVTTRTTLGLMLLAENMLGVLEAAYAVARWENLAFILDTVTVVLDISDEGKMPPELDIAQLGDSDRWRLVWNTDCLDWLNGSGREEVQDFLRMFLFSILVCTTIDPREDLDEELEAWQREETFSRALATSPVAPISCSFLTEATYDTAYWLNTPPPSPFRRVESDGNDS